jgi:hypothetical protein
MVDDALSPFIHRPAIVLKHQYGGVDQPLRFVSSQNPFGYQGRNERTDVKPAKMASPWAATTRSSISLKI